MVTVTVAINLDKTPPAVTPSRLPAANAAGWNTNVAVSFVGNDALSGVAACTTPTTLSSEGRNQSASGTCADVAGNVSPPVTVTGINIDKTTPTLAFGAAFPVASAAGWNNTNVNFPFTTADNLSGVASTSVPGPLLLSAEGTAVSGTVTVIDLAVNSATFRSAAVKIDKTTPIVAFAAGTPAANGAGWNNTNVNIPFTATDALSGLAASSIPSPLVLTAEGSAVTGSVTLTDVAGNTATYTSPSVKIDKTPPTAQGAASPQANAAGWNNTNVTVGFTGMFGGVPPFPDHPHRTRSPLLPKPAKRACGTHDPTIGM
jgi:hypothetical protein